MIQFQRRKTAGMAGILISLSLMIIIAGWFLVTVTAAESRRNIRRLFPCDIIIRAGNGRPIDTVFAAPGAVQYIPIPHAAQIFDYLYQQNNYGVCTFLAAGTGVILGPPPEFQEKQKILLFFSPLHNDVQYILMVPPPYRPYFLPDPLQYESLKNSDTYPYAYLDSTAPDQNLSMQKIPLPTEQSITSENALPGFSSYAFIDSQSFYKIFQHDAAHLSGYLPVVQETGKKDTLSIVKTGPGEIRSLPFLFSLPAAETDRFAAYEYPLAPSYILVSLANDKNTTVEQECVTLQTAFRARDIHVKVESNREAGSPLLYLITHYTPFFIFLVVFFLLALFFSCIGFVPAVPDNRERLRPGMIYKQIFNRLGIYIILGIVWGIIFVFVYCGWGDSPAFDFTGIIGARPPAVTVFPFEALPELFAVIAAAVLLTVHLTFFAVLLQRKRSDQAP